MRVPLIVVNVDGKSHELGLVEVLTDVAGNVTGVRVEAGLITTTDDAGRVRPIGLRRHPEELS